MRPNPIASWELRIGDFRVYYDVEDRPETKVVIRAIVIKDREKTELDLEGQEDEEA